MVQHCSAFNSAITESRTSHAFLSWTLPVQIGISCKSQQCLVRQAELGIAKWPVISHQNHDSKPHAGCINMVTSVGSALAFTGRSRMSKPTPSNCAAFLQYCSKLNKFWIQVSEVGVKHTTFWLHSGNSSNFNAAASPIMKSRGNNVIFLFCLMSLHSWTLTSM